MATENQLKAGGPAMAGTTTDGTATDRTATDSTVTDRTPPQHWLGVRNVAERRGPDGRLRQPHGGA